MNHPDTVLISDAQREHALTSLREACVDGRLTLQEFSDRVDAVLVARTQTQIEPAVRDLAATPPKRDPRRWLVSLLGDSRRAGRWRIGPQTTAVTLMGDCELDLRHAQLLSPEAEITAYILMGDVKIIVPEGIDVDVDSFTLMGDEHHDVTTVRPLPGSPSIRVRAYVLMGDVKVESRS